MKALIIDDERLARQEIRKLLEPHSEVEIVGECSDADEAIEEIKKSKPDLLLLDIHMPEKSGFDLLQELDEVPEVIFISAYDQYAIDAFKVNALDYLLKPVEEDLLANAIEKVRKRLRNQPATEDKNEVLKAENQIFIKDGEKCWFVTLKDIRYFESYGNYVRVYFENNKPLILKSLNNLSERLDEKTFFRANRKHLINLLWVDKIENWFNGGLRVTMKDGVEIEISRRQSSRFREVMSL